MSQASVVIVGAGHGGYQVAASLRQRQFQGEITLIGDEPSLPYQRPPLSKEYLAGHTDVTKLALRHHDWYTDQRIMLLHRQVVAIERDRRQVLLDNGQTVGYSHLVLATGARNRVVSVPGADLHGVSGIRTLAEADALAPLVRQARDVVVIGAGFIGLEFAAVAALHGAAVQVLELAERPMARAISTPMSRHFRDAHESRGVRFQFGQVVNEIVGESGRVVGVATADGHTFPADLVVYGVGVAPNTALATEAGLAVDNGIRVDEYLLTDDPAISALGDAASFPCQYANGAITRLESVQNAADQGRNIAARLTGEPSPYTALPWFWSHQHDLKLQIAGLSHGHDQTVELSMQAPEQKTVLCFKREQLIAVETVNHPRDHMLARTILTRGLQLAPSQASGPGFDLKIWAQAS